MAFIPCANPECEYAANGDPEVSVDFCCEKCEGRFNGEEWASGGKKKHTAYCTSKQENGFVGGGGFGGRVHGQCAHPECTYMVHSDPSVTNTGLYCCEKCEGLDLGEEWAQGGKRHYKTCERVEASEAAAAMPGSFGKASFGKGKGAWGPYQGKGGSMGMLMQMVEHLKGKTGAQTPFGKGIDAGQAKSWSKGGKGEGKSEGKASKGPSPLSQFPSEQKCWVGNIPQGTTQEELKAFFGLIGEPKYVTCRGTTGVVAFASDIEAQTAIEVLNGAVFGDSEVQLQVDAWTGK